MIVNAEAVNLAFKGFKSLFTDACLETPANADRIVMTVPSASRDETCGWLGQFPSMREWVGPRHVKNLVANGFVISNRKFESTLEISRDDIADDKLGISPTVLLVPPSLEEEGLYLLNTEFGEGGASNPWKGTAKLIVTPYL
jgi:phage major head subunit gpT-like protein